MLKNYIKVAIRGLLKNRIASIINILGLTVGLTCFILIFLFVKNELSYDAFHSKADHIFRVTTIDEALGVSSNNVGITNPRMTIDAKAEIPEVTLSTRLLTQGRTRIENGDDVIYAEDAKYVESSFFDVFDYKLIGPQSKEKFEAPRKLMLNESLAKKTFRDEDPIGKMVTIDEEDWEVVGIVQQNHELSHLKFDMLMSLYPTQADSSFAQYLNGWQGLGMIGYLVLNDPSSESSVEGKLKDLALKNEVPEFWIPQLQPLKEAHLYSSNILFDGNNENKGDIIYVYSLSAIAVFVVLIAAFNFMNLSTAKSTTRAKEVGIRKVMGSNKNKLVIQHLGESIFVCLISLVLALVLTFGISSYVNIGMEGNLMSYFMNHPEVLIYLIAIALVIGLVAGIYPAFVLSHYNPVVTLRGKFQTGKQGILLRKVLVVVQFVASITLIISTVLIMKQLDFIRNKDLGFNKSQVITIQTTDPGMGANMDAFRDKLKQFESIQGVAYSSNMPGRTFGRTAVVPEGVPENEENWIVSTISFDDEYLDVMGIKVIQGRNYGKEFGTDQDQAILVNEAFISQVGWENAIGKKLTLGNGQERTIVGVVKDFHFASMRHSIEPLIMFYNQNPNGNLSLKVAGDIRNAVQMTETTWNEFYTEYPFEYQFFDDEFDQIFKSDEDFSRLALNFTWLAIFIACLGLFGLSTYMAEQRRKEIGIRKVLGSKVTQVIFLLSKEFVLLIFIAAVLAWPIAFLASNSWLADFQYRIDLLSAGSIAVFVLSGLAALLIGLITVGVQSYAASVANPVQSLRDE